MMIPSFLTNSVILLLSFASLASAWMVPQYYVGRILPTRSMITRLAAGPFFEDEYEFECPQEDECEIVWDQKMPQPTQEVQNTATPFDEECDDEECLIDFPDATEEETNPEEAAKTSRAPTTGEQKHDQSWEKARMKLEMNYQVEECETDEDSCEDFCPECAGSGKMPCRFCHGTGMVAYGNDIRTCMMCNEGFEECSSCRGTGKIAPWVTTFLEENKMP